MSMRQFYKPDKIGSGIVDIAVFGIYRFRSGIADETDGNPDGRGDHVFVVRFLGPRYANYEVGVYHIVTDGSWYVPVRRMLDNRPTPAGWVRHARYTRQKLDGILDRSDPRRKLTVFDRDAINAKSKSTWRQ